MLKRSVNLPLLLCWVVCLVSCSSANNKPLSIRFSPDSNTIVFSGIDPAGLLQVRNMPHIDTAYAEVLSVIQIPDENDTAGLERPFSGKIHFTDSTIVFEPSAPFDKGKSYRVRSYLNAKFGNAAMILTGKLNHNVKPEQIILKR